MYNERNIHLRNVGSPQFDVLHRPRPSMQSHELLVGHALQSSAEEVLLAVDDHTRVPDACQSMRAHNLSFMARRQSLRAFL